MQTDSKLALFRADRAPALPDYAARHAALHCALVNDCEWTVSTIDWPDGASGIDAGCGDGFTAYSLAPASRLWVSPENEVSHDDILVYEVTVETFRSRLVVPRIGDNLRPFSSRNRYIFRVISCDLL